MLSQLLALLLKDRYKILNTKPPAGSSFQSHLKLRLGSGLYFALGRNQHKNKMVEMPSVIALLDICCGLSTALLSLEVGILNGSDFV